MTKGINVFVDGKITEVSEKELARQIRKIGRLYVRIKKGYVRFYDNFSVKPYAFEEYVNLGVFILQKRDKKETKFARDILRKDDSLLVALIEGEEIVKALREYGREGDAVSEYEENPEKPVRRAA